MNDKLDAYCGIYCGSCIIRLAHVQNRPETIPEPWKTMSKGMVEASSCTSCETAVTQAQMGIEFRVIQSQSG